MNRQLPKRFVMHIYLINILSMIYALVGLQYIILNSVRFFTACMMNHTDFHTCMNQIT